MPWQGLAGQELRIQNNLSQTVRPCPNGIHYLLYLRARRFMIAALEQTRKQTTRLMDVFCLEHGMQQANKRLAGRFHQMFMCRSLFSHLLSYLHGLRHRHLLLTTRIYHSRVFSTGLGCVFQDYPIHLPSVLDISSIPLGPSGRTYSALRGH